MNQGVLPMVAKCPGEVVQPCLDMEHSSIPVDTQCGSSHFPPGALDLDQSIRVVPIGHSMDFLVDQGPNFLVMSFCPSEASWGSQRMGAHTPHTTHHTPHTTHHHTPPHTTTHHHTPPHTTHHTQHTTHNTQHTTRNTQHKLAKLELV